MTNAERHTALLRALSKNLNDEVSRRAYADFLSEIGNPGWFVVAKYPPMMWVVPAEGRAATHGARWTNQTKKLGHATYVALPWLGCSVPVTTRGPASTLVKATLLRYAELSPEVRGD